MKFRCERDVLVEALGTATRAVASRGGALPVLSGVKAELDGDRLSLTGSDLDLTIQVGVTVAGQRDGVAVLPARLTADIVRSLAAGAVHVDAEGDEARISSGRSEFSVRLLPAEDFPRLPETPGDEVTLEAEAFAEALKQVVRAASHDDARPILTGVLMAAEGDGLRLVATDSYRLAVRDLRGTTVLREGQTVLVPSKALGELTRVLAGAESVTLRLAERDATFVVGETRLTTRLIEGDFPNYEQLIPSGYPNKLTVKRDVIHAAVERVRLVGQGRDTAPIRLAMTAQGLELSAVAQDVGEAHESVEAKYEGADLTVAFNSQFLLEGIEAAGAAEVVVESIDPLKPAVLRGTDNADYLYLLMPVRIS